MLTLLAALAATAVPSALAVPPGQTLVVSARARGVQRYTCMADPQAPGSYRWGPPAPEAVLSDARGAVVARHYAGPTWEAPDGGKVVGRLAAKVKSPDGRGVDWLLLQAKTAPDTGAFAHTSYIRRLDTEGGQAPAGGCSAASVGQANGIPYTATYEFYRPQS